MSKVRKPVVRTKCPANAFAGLNQRIIEINFPGTKGDIYEQGCLISLRIHEGQGIVEVYQADSQVRVTGAQEGVMEDVD